MCCSTFIKKMKPGPVEDQFTLRFVVGSKESRSGKDSLKTLHDAAIPLAVLEEVKEVEHLGGSAKPHNPAALAKGEGCDPDGNEPVLTVRHSELRMGNELKEEFAISAQIG
jgi:hypothetical protein